MQSFEYKKEQTEDGSPTLRLGPTWEPMHALEGAFTETLYIYQPTIRNALNASETARVLSIGLGLGYNEILFACETIKMNVRGAAIDSYESVEPLRTGFSQWIQNKPTELSSIYNDILSLYSKSYEISESTILQKLNSLYDTGTLRLYPTIDNTTPFQKSQGILFDAFSSKSSPELWTEEFLNSFLTIAADNVCFFSTYASQGNLNRALKNHNFNVEKKAGFGKKRESTFAQK
jgi:hypothetical protein